MAFNFPNLINRYCLGIVACGRFMADDQESIMKISDRSRLDRERIAEFTRGKVVHSVRLELGGADPNHLHLDLYKVKSLGEAAPVVNSTIEEIQKMLNDFRGAKATVHFAGYYLVPRDKLPGNGLIRSAFFSVAKGDASITAAGGRYRIEGSPVQSIDWNLDDDADNVQITLTSEYFLDIDENFFSEAYRIFDSAFKVLILGE